MRAEQRAGAGACAARRGTSGLLVMSSGGAAPTQAVVSIHLYHRRPHLERGFLRLALLAGWGCGSRASEVG